MSTNRQKGSSRGRAAFVSNEIRRKISEKVYRAGESLPPERALADEFGVSRITIRSSLEALTVEGLVERRPGVGNFVVDRRRKHDRARTAAVGLIVQQIDNPYYSALAMQLERRLAEHDLSLVIAGTGQDPEEERAALERMKRENVRGMILGVSSDEIRNAHLRSMAADGMTAVVLGEVRHGRALWDTVFSNDDAGVFAAVDHLVALGHERIGYVCAMSHGRLDTREPIVKHELANRGLSTEMCVNVGIADFEGGRAGLDMVLDAGATATLTTNDITALGVVQRAGELGVSIPRDLSVVGYDDIPMASMASTPLTTVATPTSEIADLAFERLFARINGRGGRPVSVILEPELIVRGSTAQFGKKERKK